MNEVFYRKWRPKILGDVVGQEPITRTLQQAVNLDRIAHAYLFCGPRGTGKTSTARILAKSVNCLSTQNGNPDNECHLCSIINENRCLDLIEIDAASNRGIDDIRNLSDKVHFSPNEARFKVYIIDEVHMLTEPAFNALLKTLEEPPPHAIFILATTEAHKLPLTIVSRCQRFDFRRIPFKLMTEKLEDICINEGIEFTKPALELISRNSGGGLRDAENLLEQVSISYDSPISEENIRDMLGLGDDDSSLELVEHIINRRIKEGLKLINHLFSDGKDLIQLHKSILEFLRTVLLIKTNAEMDFGYPDQVLEKLNSFATTVDLNHLTHTMKIFADVDIRKSDSSPLNLELALIESKDSSSEQTPSRANSVSSYSGKVETQIKSPPRQFKDLPPTKKVEIARSPEVGKQNGSVPRSQPNVQPDPSPTSYSSEMEQLNAQWKEMSNSLRHVGRKFKIGALLNVCKSREINEKTITLKFSHISNMERMREELDNPEINKAFKDILEQVMGADYEINLSVVDNMTNAPGKSTAQKSHLVRAAQAMGARIIGEREDLKNDE